MPRGGFERLKERGDTRSRQRRGVDGCGLIKRHSIPYVASMNSLRLRRRCLRAAAWSVLVLMVAILGLNACSTVSWQPLQELARGWRGRTLRVGEHCGVVARSRGQAEEVYHFYGEILAALREIEVPPPENVLILVTEKTGICCLMIGTSSRRGCLVGSERTAIAGASSADRWPQGCLLRKRSSTPS